MKRKIVFLFTCVLVALYMIMPCFADEETAELVTEITTEVMTEMSEPVENAEEPVENADDEWEAFKAKITDVSTWTMIGAALLTILTTVGTVKSKFDKVASLVHTKADGEAIAEELKTVEAELKKSYLANHKEVSATLQRYEEALKNTEANEQRLYAILTLFMTNCKISESAKAEILNILADVKKYEGSPCELVAQAQEAIDNEIAEKEAQVPATPTLDKILDEDYMELG